MKNRILPLCVTLLLICSFLLSGCADHGSDSRTDTSVTTRETESETESESIPTRALTINIANMCGTDIGMFSIIDPVSGEQRNLDSLEDKQVISINANWPDSVTEFQWALYNQNGELCSEGRTDISAARESVTLTLNGNGDFESVDESFD